MSSTPFRQRLALQVLAKRNNLKSAGTQGFTLIELLVVVVILGVLGGVGYGAYLAQIGRANEGAARTAATAMAKSCSALRITDQATDWIPAVDNERVTTTSTACTTAGQQTFQVVAGAGTANVRTCTATLNSEGSVVPAACV